MWNLQNQRSGFRDRNSRGPRYVTVVGTAPIIAHRLPEITHLEAEAVRQTNKRGFNCEKVFAINHNMLNKCFIFQI